MNLRLLLVVVSLAIAVCTNGASAVIVSTAYGRVEGNTVQLDDGVSVNSWYGIPFAAPPVGQFRFEVGSRTDFTCKIFLSERSN